MSAGLGREDIRALLDDPSAELALATSDAEPGPARCTRAFALPGTQIHLTRLSLVCTMRAWLRL
jgi:hypothetical protein